jgi:hypothetical protein
MLPGIQGCHAIVMVTDRGMFGYHNAGGSGPAQWAGRAGGFATFYNENFVRSPGTRLYGVTYVAFRKQGNKAEIYVRSWNDGNASPKVMNSDRANH